MKYQNEEWRGNGDYSLLIAETVEPKSLLSHFFEKMFGCSFEFITYEHDSYTHYRGIAEVPEFDIGLFGYKRNRQVHKDYYLPILLNGASTLMRLSFSHIELWFALTYINHFARDYNMKLALIDDSANPFVVRHDKEVFVVTANMHEGLQKVLEIPFELRDRSQFNT